MYDELQNRFPDWDTEKALDLVEMEWGHDAIDTLMRENDIETLVFLVEECIQENPRLCEWE